MANAERTLIEAAELTLVYLDECHVTRGTSTSGEPGDVTSSFDVSLMKGEVGYLQYQVSSEHKFTDIEGEIVAVIRAKFASLYTLDEGFQPTESQAMAFGKRSVMNHVIPFLREFLATMTNRLAITPFYLPVFRGLDAIQASPNR